MATQLCTKCGSKLPPNANHCPACGAPVRRSPGTQARGPQAGGKRQQKQGSGLSGMTLLAVGGAVLVLLAGLVFGLSLSQPATTAGSVPQAAVPSVPQVAAPTAAQQAIPNPEVPRISVADAKARYDSGTAILVDARSLEEYQASHIDRAVSLPLNTLQTRYGELARDAEIITYCT